MDNYEKYIKLNNFIYLEMVKVKEKGKPSRIILGKEVADILMKNSPYLSSDTEINKDALLSHGRIGSFVGYPITIDYENPWIIMICSGKEINCKEMFEGENHE